MSAAVLVVGPLLGAGTVFLLLAGERISCWIRARQIKTVMEEDPWQQ